MTDLSAQSISIVVLAAGRGSRMGDVERTKLLLPWRDGKPLLWHTVQNALGLNPLEVIVVVRPDRPEMQELLRDLPVRCVPNPRYIEGMGTSLATGIEAVGEQAQSAILLLGDEPDVSQEVIARLVAAYMNERKEITIGVYGEQPGPPSIFARAIFPELMLLGGDEGARHIVATHPDQVRFVRFTADEMPHDIDTPEDLAY